MNKIIIRAFFILSVIASFGCASKEKNVADPFAPKIGDDSFNELAKEQELDFKEDAYYEALHRRITKLNDETFFSSDQIHRTFFTLNEPIVKIQLTYFENVPDLNIPINTPIVIEVEMTSESFLSMIECERTPISIFNTGHGCRGFLTLHAYSVNGIECMIHWAHGESQILSRDSDLKIAEWLKSLNHPFLLSHLKENKN